MTVKKYLKESIKLGDQELTVETGRVAKQADGSVIVRYGDTMLLVAAVAAAESAGRNRLFPAHRRVSRIKLCGRPHSRKLLPA